MAVMQNSSVAATGTTAGAFGQLRPREQAGPVQGESCRGIVGLAAPESAARSVLSSSPSAHR
jgi:hypothetical protein